MPTTKRKKKDKEIAILQSEAITDEFIARCDDYLQTRKQVLWGQSFDIKDPKRRRIAAEWLASEIVALLMCPVTEGNET